MTKLRGRACTRPSLEAGFVLSQFYKDFHMTFFREDLRTVKSCCFDSTLEVKAHNLHIPVMWLNQYEKHNWKI